MTSNASDAGPRTLVLGYGNTLRSDDGFGWRVAAEFSRMVPGADSRAIRQLTPELAEAVSRADLVLFVDAAANGEPGQLCCREVLAGEAVSALSHQMTPARLLWLARSLYGGAARGIEVSVCGESFALGEGLSPAVEARLAEALRVVSQLAG